MNTLIAITLAAQITCTRWVELVESMSKLSPVQQHYLLTKLRVMPEHQRVAVLRAKRYLETHAGEFDKRSAKAECQYPEEMGA